MFRWMYVKNGFELRDTENAHLDTTPALDNLGTLLRLLIYT